MKSQFWKPIPQSQQALTPRRARRPWNPCRRRGSNTMAKIESWVVSMATSLVKNWGFWHEKGNVNRQHSTWDSHLTLQTWWSLAVRTLNSWIPMFADNYSMTFSWLTHCWPIITRLKCQILAGECNILVGKFPFWMDTLHFWWRNLGFSWVNHHFWWENQVNHHQNSSPKTKIPCSTRDSTLWAMSSARPLARDRTDDGDQLRNNDFSTGGWLSWLLFFFLSKSIRFGDFLFDFMPAGFCFCFFSS